MENLYQYGVQIVINALTEEDFDKLSAQYGTPKRIIKQDYAALAALDLIAGSSLSEILCFKGGTAIKRIYFPEARFSVDLDFEYLGELPEDISENFIEKTMEEIRENLVMILKDNVSGSVFFENLGEIIAGSKWGTITVDYRLPGLKFHLRIDVEFTNIRSSSYSRRRIIPHPYGGNCGEINTLSLSDILVSKIIALYDRTTAKDLWDIYFLFLRNVKPAKRLGELVSIDLKQLIKAIEIISETDWMLTEDYIPKTFKVPDLKDIQNSVREYLVRIW